MLSSLLSSQQSEPVDERVWTWVTLISDRSGSAASAELLHLCDSYTAGIFVINVHVTTEGWARAAFRALWISLKRL